jgi:hypothetical protein
LVINLAEIFKSPHMNTVNSLEEFSWAENYLSYLNFIKKGLKSQAKNSLDSFLLDYQNQKISIRRNFLDKIAQIAFNTKDYSNYLPQNFYKNVFETEIANWIKEEPTNVKALRWSPDINLNKRALELDPNDQLTLEIYGNKILNRIKMNQHELDAGFAYDGNANEDLNQLLYFSNYVKNINDPVTRNRMNDLVIELLNTAKKHIS